LVLASVQLRQVTAQALWQKLLGVVGRGLNVDVLAFGARSLWQKLLCVVGRGLNVDVLAFGKSCCAL
jgi:hypothetical protein